jgi:hypothetical protein
MKSKNHETRRGVLLSHVEATIKIWESLEQVVASDAQNPDISTCDHCDPHAQTIRSTSHAHFQPMYVMRCDDQVHPTCPN